MRSRLRKLEKAFSSNEMNFKSSEIAYSSIKDDPEVIHAASPEIAILKRIQMSGLPSEFVKFISKSYRDPKIRVALSLRVASPLRE
jgi:hypothetical protein